ncbi:MAG: hypothetical protein HY936_01750 [Nitrosomonadales bacterium]|nr:hypothetical protein [Nitrosomonadales bacterium]
MKFAGWIFSGLMSVAGSVSAKNSIAALNVGDNSNGTTIVRVELAQPLADLPSGAGFIRACTGCHAASVSPVRETFSTTSFQGT